MKWGVVVFPGSNCDQDVFFLLKEVLQEDVVYLWHGERDLNNCDVIVLPGGFSYGDYLRAGAIARFSPIMSEIVAFANKGGTVLGICNGFQVLLEAGLLPGAMLVNADLRFHCHEVEIKVMSKRALFTKNMEIGQKLTLPVAHFTGNYYAPPDMLKELFAEEQVVFCYEKNPNGSVADIAGICNKKGNVLGLMPHPERRGEEVLGGCDGRLLFESFLQSKGS